MRRWLVVVFIATFISNNSLAQTLPAGFAATRIASGWSEPVGCTFNVTGTKFFVWEKNGRVYLCNRNTSTGVYTKQATPVIDLSAEVGNWRDHGLLGFALDPAFESNGFIYLLYVVDRHHLINFGTGSYNAATNQYFAATIGRVVRYKTATASGNVTATASTRTILIGETRSTGIPILHESHGVGTLAFAADGTLLVSAGDAASYNTTDTGSLAETYYSQAITDGIIRSNENKGAFRSQMINSHCGKILRIDPATGNGISSNPFYNSSSPRSAASRMWAMGFRNPYRFTVKPGLGSTNPSVGDLGELYVVDVGWSSYEELNIVRAKAQNCGWPLFEGFRSLNSYVNMSPNNLDELNPLFGTGGCTKRYYNFKELLKQATADGNNTIYNPCNGSQQIASTNKNRFFHRVPSLDWKHYADSARVGYFSGNNLQVAQIGTAASGVTGIPFSGAAGMGGIVYTGNMFPAEYKNRFFMADYGSNWMKTVTMQSADKVESVDNFESGGFAAVVGFAQNPADGSVFVADIGTNEIIRISYGGNKFPVVKMSSNKLYGAAPLAVTFSSTGSSDPEGGALTYVWNWGDGTANSTAANPSHTFTAPNSNPRKFVVTLSVKDNQNQVSVDSIIISANNTPPNATITSPAKNSTYRLGADTLYALRATVTDAQHTAGQLKYEWQTFLRHNAHQHAEPADTNKNTSTLISRIGCNGDAYYYMIKLTVTDAAGLSKQDSSKIYPPCGVVATGLFYTDAVARTGFNEVIWVTESEINLKSFSVEKSCSGLLFQPFSEIAASGGAGFNNYSINDAVPCSGVTYYRVKLNKNNGSFEYSHILPVRQQQNDSPLIIATPMPFSHHVVLRVDMPAAATGSIRFTDAAGKVVHQQTGNFKIGVNNIEAANLYRLPPGTYTVSISAGIFHHSLNIIKL